MVTPVTPAQDERISCETLWVAQSHSGDYHDNVTSDMFMLWVKQKLCPLFEKNYPGNKMVLITDKALYHHAQEIRTLGHLSKKLC